MVKNISAFLVVKNGENNIVRCLESIKDVVGEIVVVLDVKCKDKTIEIIKKYTKKIFIENKERNNPEYLKVKYFNKHKNEKIFKYEYILSIDADEELSDELKQEIKNLELTKYDCYYIKRINIGQKIREGKYYLRLFNINKIKLFGFYHSDFEPSINAKISYLKRLLYHHTYNKNFVDWAFLEAKGIRKKYFNFYNYSLSEKLKKRIYLYFKANLILRKLYRIYLYKKYTSKYGYNVSKKRLEYYDKLTQYLKSIK